MPDTWSVLRAICVSAVLFLAASGTAPAADDKGLDHQSLKALLENLGYEPKEQKYSNGNPYYRIEPKLNGRTWYFNVRAPDKGRYVYVQLDFGKYPSEDGIPRQALIELLKENGNTSYSFFFIASWGGFMLTSNLLNDDLKPVDFRRSIEEMMALAAKTESHWNPKKWPQDKDAAAAENKDAKKDN